ncbi:MAG: hypothetical protein ABR499_02855 [Gemmatimonadaceae bacterium]
MRHHRVLDLLLLALLLLAPVSRTEPGWFSPDRVKHFFMSFFVQSAGYSVARAANLDHAPALGVATGATAAAAFSKELWDRKRGTGFDRRDLVSDALGAGAATLLLLRTVDE